MRKLPFATYQSASEIARQIKEKQSMANALPPGDTRQKLLVEVARLKTYAEMKRWTGMPPEPAEPAP